MKLAKYLSAAAIGLVAAPAVADSIDPASVEATIRKGETITIDKEVTVTMDGPISTRADIVFLSDVTGSMFSVIDDVQTNAAQILSDTEELGDVWWGVGSYQDFPIDPWGGASDSPFDLIQDLTGNVMDVQDGIDMWSASGGADIPESGLHALEQTAEEFSWRDGSARFAIWFSDAPNHEPTPEGDTPDYPGPTVEETIAALNAENVSVLAINSGDLDDDGRAGDVVDGTDGVLVDLMDADDVVDVINDAIDEFFEEYNEVRLGLASGDVSGLDIDYGDAITGDFDRSEDRTFNFEVTITGTELGHYEFEIAALVDGVTVAIEDDRINVVPLPAAAPLMLGGLAALGFMARRRKG